MEHRPGPWLWALLLILFATPFPAALTPNSPMMSQRDSSVMTDASPQPRHARPSFSLRSPTVGQSLSKNGILFVEDETMLDVWASPNWHAPPRPPSAPAPTPAARSGEEGEQEPVSYRDFFHPAAASSARSQRLSAHTSPLPPTATPHPTSATPRGSASGRGAGGRTGRERDLFFGTPAVTQPEWASRLRGEGSSTAWSDDALSLEELLSSRDASPSVNAEGGVASVQVRFRSKVDGVAPRAQSLMCQLENMSASPTLSQADFVPRFP